MSERGNNEEKRRRKRRGTAVETLDESFASGLNSRREERTRKFWRCSSLRRVIRESEHRREDEFTSTEEIRGRVIGRDVECTGRLDYSEKTEVNDMGGEDESRGDRPTRLLALSVNQTLYESRDKRRQDSRRFRLAPWKRRSTKFSKRAWGFFSERQTTLQSLRESIRNLPLLVHLDARGSLFYFSPIENTANSVASKGRRRKGKRKKGINGRHRAKNKSVRRRLSERNEINGRRRFDGRRDPRVGVKSA
ncbi:hypothetical protein KM043_000589 [Ampulex compressa]|nr:hypothetical protein KM043_000589 [Ampulex compressa]